MKKSFFVALLAAHILLYGCSSNNLTKDNPKNIPVNPSTPAASSTKEIIRPGFTKETYPKIDGSTATIPLSEALASSILQISKEEASKFIKHNTTHDAYVNLINGKADMILVTEPSKEELALAKDAKIELEVIPIVKEGFVFLVNTKNPVNSLTQNQIKAIYQGKIKSWKEVGGADEELIAYQRESNSGSQTLMQQLVMKDTAMINSPKTIVYGMDGLIESIAKYDNSEKALGYSVFYYAKTMYNRDTIKLIAVDGVFPENKTIASGKYPYSTCYYAVLNKKAPSEAPARKLLEWLLSKDGQKLAEASGYVPLEVK
ncbi:substrate-binding domain-containing protein [Clostridium swellfunianum]|uniref:PstS family phosphate ABC transporter substrate-binding protein n=1 Tax=Clostridium swellfunianum TaxID=1367462 RepID=UPI00202EC80C|nr:substrate-binding domain-containing protein [Clostridium swellfunianum]MCM0650916.1 substrate-binding domain-containing protein [Clostridium swellfunianum]